jgi:hypothetical protein
VVIASRVGDKLPDYECIVERSQSAPFLNGGNTVQFYLNCNGEFATANRPGTSVGTQAGREAKAADDAARAEAEAEWRAQQEAALAEASAPDE